MKKLQDRFETETGKKSTTERGNISPAYVSWLENVIADAHSPTTKDGLLWECQNCWKAYVVKLNAENCCPITHNKKG